MRLYTARHLDGTECSEEEYQFIDEMGSAIPKFFLYMFVGTLVAIWDYLFEKKEEGKNP